MFRNQSSDNYCPLDPSSLLANGWRRKMKKFIQVGGEGGPVLSRSNNKVVTTAHVYPPHPHQPNSKEMVPNIVMVLTFIFDGLPYLFIILVLKCV